MAVATHAFPSFALLARIRTMLPTGHGHSAASSFAANLRFEARAYVNPGDALKDVSDDELMIRLQEGVTAAFEMLTDRYEASLVGFFFRNTRDRQLSEDLTQETLLRVYNQSWDYLPTGRFRGWMYRIARNLMIDNMRRQSNDALVKAVRGKPAEQEADLLSSIAGSLVPPHQVATQHELSELVDEVLAELPEDQRITFTLFHYGGLPLPEVAGIMETTLSTTKSRLRLAREKLQKLLKARGVNDPTAPLADSG